MLISARQEGPGRGRQQNPKFKAGPAPPASACGEEPDKSTEDVGASVMGRINTQERIIWDSVRHGNC